MKFVFLRKLSDFWSILQKKNCAENEKSGADRLFLILSAMSGHASHLCSIWTDLVLFILKNLILRKPEAEKNAPNVLRNFTYEYLWSVHTPEFGGFPCSHPHNLLMSDQPDPIDNFSPKYIKCSKSWKTRCWRDIRPQRVYPVVNKKC